MSANPFSAPITRRNLLAAGVAATAIGLGPAQASQPTVTNSTPTFGIISQLDPLRNVTSSLHVKLALTGTVIALIASILAAFSRHEYKKWDVKARVSPRRFRGRLSKVYLLTMRGLMWVATVSISGALSTLMAGLWM